MALTVFLTVGGGQGFFVEGYSNHLYRFKGKGRIVMQAVRPSPLLPPPPWLAPPTHYLGGWGGQVEVKISSLNEGDSFVLDVGRKLFVWTGAQSNPR
jgi:hypothetical protein